MRKFLLLALVLYASSQVFAATSAVSRRHVASSSTGSSVSPIAPSSGLLIGDSITVGYGGTENIEVYLLSDADNLLGTTIANQAVAGNSIGQQNTIWNADASKATYDWIVVMVGLNDLNPAETAVTALGRLQDLIDDINSGKKSSATVLLSTMTPAKARLIEIYGAIDGATSYQKWLDMNEAIMGGGANAITGVSYRVSKHTEILSDGSGNLALAYDVGDHIHENNDARSRIAEVWREALNKAGYLLPSIQINPNQYFTSSGSNVILKDGNLGVGTVTPTAALHVIGSVKATDLTINSSSVFNSTGQIGIGTTNPSATLDVIASSAGTIGAIIKAGSGVTPKPPDEVGNLASWLKADALSFSDNDPVDVWTDSSGNSKSATQSSAGNKPIYKTNIVNGKPILRFDGTNDSMTVSSLAMNTFTIMVVIKLTSTAGMIWEHSADANSSRGSSLYGSTGATAYVNPIGGPANAINYTGDWAVNNVWKIATIRYAGTADSHKLYVNGILAVAGSGSSAMYGTVTDNFYIGSRGGASLFCTGDIAEVLIFDAALSDADMDAVTSYLGTKYSIAVTPLGTLSPIQQWKDLNGNILATIDGEGRLGIGTDAPTDAIDVTGSMKLAPQSSPPSSPDAGDMYTDSTATPDELCFYDGANWQGISSGTDANCA